jgi:CCR4-NOT transcription complex subunit 4
LNTRTTATGVASSQSLTKSKADPQSNSFSSSSTVSSTKLPSSWNDDTSTVPKMTEGRDSLSKTLKPYKPGIAKETQAVTSLESSLDIDFSTIPSAWNDDDVTSDGMSKGSDEKQVVNDNGKFECSVSSKPAESGHLTSKSTTSPKKDIAVNSTRQSPLNCVSSPSVSKSEVKDGDGDYQVTNMASKTSTLVIRKDQSNQAAIDTATEDTRSESTDIDRLSVGVSSVTLSRKDGVQSIAENQQPDAILSTSVVVPFSQNLKLAECNDSTCQPSSDKHRDWCSDIQSSVSPQLNDIESYAVATDKSHGRVLDAADQASSSPYVHFPNTAPISLWNGKEINHTSTSDRTSTMMQPGLLSSVDSTSTMLNGHQEGLGTIYAPGKVSEHPRMKNHQPGAVGAVRIDNIGSFDKAVSVNKDESSIIADILSLEFDPWDESYSTANNFAKMLSASEKNDVLFDARSWKTKTSNSESRFSFARQDNQGSLLDSSMRNYKSEQNFSLPSQNSHGNIYQSGIAFQSPEEGFSKSNSLTMLDMLATGE